MGSPPAFTPVCCISWNFVDRVFTDPVMSIYSEWHQEARISRRCEGTRDCAGHWCRADTRLALKGHTHQSGVRPDLPPHASPPPALRGGGERIGAGRVCRCKRTHARSHARSHACMNGIAGAPVLVHSQAHIRSSSVRCSRAGWHTHTGVSMQRLPLVLLHARIPQG